jgi:hypothetical protein
MSDNQRHSAAPFNRAPKPRKPLAPGEARLIDRQETAKLVEIYKAALVNGHQFRTSDGKIKQVITAAPNKPEAPTGACLSCGRKFELNPNAKRPRKYCDRVRSVKYATRVRRAMISKASTSKPKSC